MRGKNKKLILILVIVIVFTILAGCEVLPSEPIQETSVPEIISQAPCITPTISITQMPTQAQVENKRCTENGHVERYLIDSELMDGDLYFSVYFPPCYSEIELDGYPVLYALHGQNFDDKMWVDLGAAEIADTLILSGEVEPFLIVMPYEEFFFRKVTGNNFPVALVEEIIPWVEKNFNVCTERECRAIGGISRGASWAMRIGFSEWERFGSIGAHSVPIFRGDITRLSYWLAPISYGKQPRIYMDIGASDPEVKAACNFENALNENDVPNEWHLNKGNHNEEYWEAHMEEYLRWYSEGWK
ncbi:MAG: hypothetical protein J7K66_05390 [Anaerolineaceae bacterium]|nr:hypothetical protein [Anaerolineaceae bacterium]